MSALSISVDQQHGAFVGDDKGVPEFAALDVVADILDALVAELARAAATLRHIRRALASALVVDLTCHSIKGALKDLGDFECEYGLAGARGPRL